MASFFDGPDKCDDGDIRVIRYRDLLPTDHPVRLIERFVDDLNVSSFEARYKVGDGQKGRAPKDIRMMLSVILYAVYRRTYSARQIDEATQCQADFWFLTNGKRISHDKISDFISLHEDEVHRVFLETIYLAHENELLDFKGLYQDGYLLKANASKKRSATMQDLTHRERRLSDRLDAIIDELKDKQIAPCLEEEKKRVSSKLLKLADLKAALQAKIAQRSEGKALWKANDIASGTTINETDPDSDKMKQKDGSYANSYLKVSAIDGKADIIVASAVDGYNDEPHIALPLFQQANENCKDTDGRYTTVVADANFTSAENCVEFEKQNIELVGPTRNYEEQKRNTEENSIVLMMKYDETRHCVICPAGAELQEKSRYFDSHKNTTLITFSNPAACQTCVRKDACVNSKTGYRTVKIDIRRPAQDRVLHRYFSEKGQALYKRRSHTAETPQGDLKKNGRFVQLVRRGVRKVRVDSIYHDIVWNLRRIFNTKGASLVWCP
jgi:transposase